jgi:hypothetical protein
MFLIREDYKSKNDVNKSVINAIFFFFTIGLFFIYWSYLINKVYALIIFIFLLGLIIEYIISKSSSRSLLNGVMIYIFPLNVITSIIKLFFYLIL